MPRYEAFTNEKYQDQGWDQPADLRFAANQGFIPIAGTELPKAVLSHPVALMQDAEQHWQCVALMSFEVQRNVHIDAQGSWSGGYLPAQLQGHPFRVFEVSREGDTQFFVSIDIDSGLVHAEGKQRFFDEQGEHTAEFRKMVNFLTDLQKNMLLTRNLLAMLAKNRLIQPWHVAIPENGQLVKIEGLYSFSEQILKVLDDKSIIALHRAGALGLIHLQLLSTHHINTLAEKCQSSDDSAA